MVKEGNLAHANARCGLQPLATMPKVSVIIPCYNEQATIGLLLDALYAQTFPRAEMEVVIADGFSTDGTRAAIAAWAKAHPDLPVRVVDNPRRIIPAGLNRAIAAARGEFIVRLDAHSVPAPDYIERSVAALEQGLGANVGGVWEITPGGKGWIARGIAAAASHPLGVGDARYRYASSAGEVDTVPFGAFRRSLIEQIGAYDESLLTNEDYEFNVRVRAAGGKVWLDPAIRSRYFARPTLAALAKQYWRYGFWKAKMLRRYPNTLRWRQALPPLFVLAFIVLGVLGIFWKPALWLWMAQVGIYALALVAAGIQTAVTRRDPALAIGVPLAIATMHFAWGSAFLASLFTPKPLKPKPNSK